MVHNFPERERHVTGTLRVTELGHQFDLELVHDDVDSFSGLVLTLLGRPAMVGERVRYERLILEVTATRGRGVEECAVTLGVPQPGDD